MEAQAQDVYSIKHDPRDGSRFELTLVPYTVDATRPYGAQLTKDIFTPTDEPTKSGTTEYYNGIVGGPEDGDEATLVIDRAAMRENRKRRREAALGAASLHMPEGTLWMSDASDNL